MSDKKLNDFYLNEISVFLDNLKICRDINAEIDPVHDMRVSIKNTRSILNLLKSLIPSKTQEQHCNIFKEVFESAGKLREIHVNQLITSEFPDLKTPKYDAFLKKKALKSNKKLRKVLNAFKVKKMKKLSQKLIKKLETIEQKSFLKSAYRQIKDELISIRNIINENQEEIKLHRLRTKLNVLRGGCRMLDYINPSDPIARIIESLDPFHKQIGQWHDDQIYLKSLDKFLSKKNLPDTDNLFMIRNSILKRKEIAQLELNIKLREFAGHI